MEDRSSTSVSKAAQHLIALHGEEAPTVAARRASQMEQIGDVRRRTTWLCVMIKAQKLLVSKHGW